MKTIGLIGGMSWESSIEYYRIINSAVQARLGGLHSARCIMYSVDFADIEPLQHEGRWADAAGLLIAAARNLENGKADFVVLCTNTMHKLADEIEKHVHIPLLHIADATAGAVKSQGLSKVGLLGTRFTMEEEFYKGRLIEKHGIDVLIPPRQQRETVHRVIYDQLCLGRIEPYSRQQYLGIIDDLADRGAEGIILGCTEIGLLVKAEDGRLPLFDTTKIHAEAAVEYRATVIGWLGSSVSEPPETERLWGGRPTPTMLRTGVRPVPVHGNHALPLGSHCRSNAAERRMCMPGPACGMDDRSAGPDWQDACSPFTV